MSIAALVLGILSLVGIFIPWIGWFAAIACGLLAVLLGVLGRKQAAAQRLPTKTATAGLVMGIIGLAMGVLTFVACVACAACGRAGLTAAKEARDEEAKQASQPSPSARALDEKLRQALESASRHQELTPPPSEPPPSTENTPPPTATAPAPSPTAPTPAAVARPDRATEALDHYVADPKVREQMHQAMERYQREMDQIAAERAAERRQHEEPGGN